MQSVALTAGSHQIHFFSSKTNIFQRWWKWYHAVVSEITTNGSGNSASAKLSHPGQGYKVGDTITVADVDGQGNNVVVTVASVGESLGGLPVDAINQAFSGNNAIKHYDIDSFCVTDLTISLRLYKRIAINNRWW